MKKGPLLVLVGIGIAGIAYLYNSEEIDSAIGDVSDTAIDLAKTGYAMVASTKSILYNNPGNLVAGVGYMGEIGTFTLKGNPRIFARFDMKANGLRAMALNALNYEIKDNINNLSDFGYRWAETWEYGINLAKRLKLNPYDYFSVIENLRQLVPAIIKNENSICPYTKLELDTACSVAYAYKGLTAYV